MNTKVKLNKVHITDVTLRDAHQSLIATRMHTDDMLPACSMLDDVGFWSLEVWGGATFDTCLRYLKEDPWERLKSLKAALPNTKLQMLLRGQNLLGYRHYPDDIIEAFITLAAKNGVDIFRVFDALNDIRNLKTAIKAIKKQNKHAQGAIAYTLSPMHSTTQYINLANELVKLGCDSIAIKDMAGLLTPNVAVDLMRALQPLSVPIHFHSHSTSGLASICLYKAIETGCRYIDTAISAFAEGVSHPCTESMVAALQNTPFETELNLDLLLKIGEYFRNIRLKYASYESPVTKIDPRILLYQIPGGMISNLYQQLKEQQAINKYEAVLKEIPRVRKDLGYPPLVTPISQIVGAQALSNVLTGNRYSTITNEVKMYIQGLYGSPPGKINVKLQQQILKNQSVIYTSPAGLLSPELPTLKKLYGNLIDSDEDLITIAMFPEIGKQFLEERKANFKFFKSTNINTRNNSVKNEKTFHISLHGVSYEVKVQSSPTLQENKQIYNITINNTSEEVIIEHSEPLSATLSSNTKQKIHQITAKMPCTIISILVRKNSKVKLGDILMLVESMKMQTEIKSPLTGTIKNILVSVGDLVKSNQLLIEIESQ